MATNRVCVALSLMKTSCGLLVVVVVLGPVSTPPLTNAAKAIATLRRESLMPVDSFRGPPDLVGGR
jgi:hypothetical protein